MPESTHSRPLQPLHRELLDAPDRDHCPGLAPVLALRRDDDPAYLAALSERARTHVELSRRGRDHGEWVELPEADAAPGSPLASAVLHQRWHTARPIVLRQSCDPTEYAPELAGRRRLFDELMERGGLRDFLRDSRESLEPHFQVSPSRAPLFDPERDIERHLLAWFADPQDERAPRAKDLWVKSGWLSAGDEDRSLRLRFSFGREGVDDASRDMRRHRRVAELAEALLPECALLHENAELFALLETFVGEPLMLTQHVAYWNAPGGGALFHHDAFEESLLGGQRGVVYAQLSGRTAWLALSIDDLAARVIEFAEYMEEGELHWVRSTLFPSEAAFERFRNLTRDPHRVRRELARPGCGAVGPLVGRGPEFSSLLADAGHALLLRPGDLILLPNHGLARTCMHSVFSAHDGPSYGLSMAIRERQPREPEPDYGQLDGGQLRAPSPDPGEDDRGPSLARQRRERRRRR